MPFRLLFLLFLIVPVAEMYLLIKVGGIIGAIPTILLVIFSAVLGVVLLRTQGLATFQRVQQSVARGEPPATAMLEGLLLLVGGGLLLVPGFLTDAVGLLCLIPVFRRYIAATLLRRYMGLWVVRSSAYGPTQGPRTIEGEFHRDD